MDGKLIAVAVNKPVLSWKHRLFRRLSSYPFVSSSLFHPLHRSSVYFRFVLTFPSFFPPDITPPLSQISPEAIYRPVYFLKMKLTQVSLASEKYDKFIFGETINSLIYVSVIVLHFISIFFPLRTRIYISHVISVSVGSLNRNCN